MRANGGTTRLTAKASFGTQMAMSMMGIGERIKPMVVGSTCMLMERSMMESGSRTCSMAMGLKHGLMALALKASMSRGKRRVTAPISGRTEAGIQGTGRTIRSKGR
jgi:hypothetical protein